MQTITLPEPTLPPIIQRVWLDERKIKRKARRIAQQIDRDYAGLNPHLVTVMKGGLFFLTDLARAMTIPHTLDFLAITSYGPPGAIGRGAHHQRPDEPIAGRHVIIVEDILDTGLTLAYIYKNLERRKPASLKVCVFLGPPLPTAHRHPDCLQGLRCARRVPGGLWAGLASAVSEPALHRDYQARSASGGDAGVSGCGRPLRCGRRFW